MTGHVYMPFAGGKYAVVAPDGQIVTEELTQQEAQDWLKRQIAQAKRDVESWPYWMKL